MGTQNKEIKIALDIQAKIDKASSQIGTLKKQIDNFELSKGLASDFAKEFKNIEHEIAELQRKTASGEINLIDAKAAEKEIDKIEKRWAFLLSKIGGESFLEKGLKTDAQAMAALESLAKSYASGIKEAEAQEAKLNKRLEEAKQKQKDIIEAQKEQKVVKASELDDQKAQLALLQQQEKAAKKARDDAEKALRTKVEESGGKYSMEQATQKGSPLRKTDAYRTFREAQAAYDTAKAKTKTQKTSVDSMVTKEMQVAEATAAKEAIDKATEALENYRKTTLATAKEDAFEKAKESLKSIAEFKDIDWDGLEIDMSSIKSVEDLEEALANLRLEADKRADAALKEIGETAEEASTGFKSMEKDIDTAKTGLQDLDEQARQVDAFEARIKQFLGMAGAVELLRRALRQAFDTTKELDAAMTEMAVVTDLEVGDYWKQLPEHTKRASELGVAIHSVYEAETLYYQQGLKTAEAQALANTTLKMAGIAGLDAAEATDKMTAALRGFKMELNETSAEKVADVYSELAAITAADVNEISSAMTKTASIASSAGMEFETTAAFLSQIIETTRESAETAGTAMKTVIARFSEVKKLQGEGLLTGSDEEGEVIDVNKIQTALRSVGISMDEFFAGTEGLDSIFLKLAEKWDTLDVKTQRYIATTAAGSRQQSRFIAMMSDYARTQELVTAANDSAGASNEQFAKKAESLEFKLNQLKDAWDEFSMGILQSDLVKFGVDALKTFLEIINKATSALDGMGGTITKVLTTIALFKLGQKIFEGIKNPMANFFTKLVKDVYGEGIKAGQAFAQGLEDSKKTEEQKQEEKQKAEQEKRKQYLDVKEPKTILQKAGDFTSDFTGVSNFAKQATINEKEEYDFKKFKTMKQEGGKKKYEQDYLDAKKKFDDVDARQKNGEIIDQKEVDEATQSLIDAEDALVHYKKTEETVQEASQKGWENVGQGFQKLGTTIAGVGVGMSMLGGIMSQLGFEEVGEGLSTVGNVLTVVGGGIAAIGAIVPVVSKILVGAGVTVQAAWWWVVAIVAAVALLAVGITAIVKSVQNNSLDAKMKKAAEATEQAKEAAQQAKEAYDELVSDRNEYQEMQKNLESLTYGTKEWKEALHEANQQVLDLIQTYPELAKYMDRGDDGQLIITDEGWDAMLEKQEKAVQNTQAVVGYRQMEEQKLKMEGAKQEFTKETKNSGAGHTEQLHGESYWVSDAANLQKELEMIYLTQDSSLEEQTGKVEELAKKYNTTTDAIQEAADALAENKEEIEAIAEESENIARANLTTTASENVTGSKFGDEVIDSFASSMNNTTETAEFEATKTALKEGKDYKNSEEFKRIGEEYGLGESDFTGNDDHDLQVLYAAVNGLNSIEDIPDEIAQNREKMIESIAAADQADKRNEKMEELVNKLEALQLKNAEQAQNIAGIFSDDGGGMTKEFAESLITTNADGVQAINEETLKEQAEALGYTGEDALDQWAAAMNKTTEELKQEALENAQTAIKTNEKAYERLNAALGKTQTKIGGAVNLTLEAQGDLANKLVGAVSLAGAEGGQNLKDTLDAALNTAGDDAEDFANLLAGINWNDADSWKELPDMIENLGISFSDGGAALQKFLTTVDSLGIAVDTVDIAKLSGEIQSMYELMKSIQSGTQGRTFDEKQYEMLTQSNEDLKEQFVQIGNEFHYVGSSMSELADALKENAVLETGKAAFQLEKQLQVQKSAQDFDETGATNDDKTLKLSNGTNGWTKEDKQAWLNQYRAYALESGVDTLSYVTNEQGQSLGLSLATNFDNMDEAQLDAALSGIANLQNNIELSNELQKALSDSKVATYQLMTGQEIVGGAQSAREAAVGGTEQEKALQEQAADEYSKALSIKAGETGMVASAVIDEYNDLISQDLSSLSDEERAEAETRMKGLEATMQSAIEQNTKSIEDLRTVNEMTEKVADAMYKVRQHEIDELANINDSINTANENMVNKIQEQIDESRRERKNAKTEQNIADKQSQLSYLMADTSGAGFLEAQALREQILEDQEAYQDDLIDQGLQQLSDDNAAAAEQRDRQISLMEASLAYAQESGNLMREAQLITIDSLNKINSGVSPLDTDMYDILSQAESIEGGMATDTMVSEFKSNFLTESSEAANAQKNLTDTVTTEKSLASLDDWLQKSMDALLAEQQAATAETNRETAVSNAAKYAKGIQGGLSIAKGTAEYTKYKNAYTQAGGKAEDFDRLVYEKGGTSLANKTFQVASSESGGDGAYIPNITDADEKGADAGVRRVSGVQYKFEITEGNSNLGQSMQSAGISTGSIVKYSGAYYYYHSGKAYPMRSYNGWGDIKSYEEIPDSAFVTKYETGGLADFTGPAWLDGTKSHPELVLNSRDTENFIQLKDILSEVMSNTDSTSAKKGGSGDNYYNIEISVEELKDDYDVEQLANKIRSMLYDDASYRNVNAISFTR